MVTTVAVPFDWRMPSGPDLALMAAMGVLAASGHFLIIRAFEHASAAVLAPYGYSEIVMATLVGLVVFGDFPDAWTWLGIAVIVASGIYISLRERRVATVPRPGVSAPGH
jgi:drug/metabolite transporter (DMT)-like permease